MSSETAESTIVKGGENIIALGIRRSSRGVVLTAKVTPAIEDYFRSQSGDSFDVNEIHREWFVGKDAAPLKVWHIVDDPGVVRSHTGAYVLNKPGFPLVVSEGPSKVVNLSFLRLVGISEGEGIKLEIKGAFTLTYIRDLAAQIGQSTKQFFVDFLKPVDILVTVNTQENR